MPLFELHIHRHVVITRGGDMRGYWSGVRHLFTRIMETLTPMSDALNRLTASVTALVATAGVTADAVAANDTELKAIADALRAQAPDDSSELAALADQIDAARAKLSSAATDLAAAGADAADALPPPASESTPTPPAPPADTSPRPPAPLPPINIDAEILEGVVGEAFIGSVHAEGGVGALAFSTSPAESNGITIDALGEVTGTPQAEGATTFSLTVTDSATPSPQQAFATITFHAAAAAGSEEPAPEPAPEPEPAPVEGGEASTQEGGEAPATVEGGAGDDAITPAPGEPLAPGGEAGSVA